VGRSSVLFEPNALKSLGSVGSYRSVPVLLQIEPVRTQYAGRGMHRADADRGSSRHRSVDQTVEPQRKSDLIGATRHS
jgi:hypothetical protein